MLTSLALIFLLGMTLGKVFEKLRLPSLIGMLFTGIILGPYALNFIDDSILMISADLRQLALVIILTRAGLSLNSKDLKKVGRPAIMMCFVPACLEILGTIAIAPRLFDITLLEAAILGTAIAAVSPAVIVPRMIKLMESGYGTKKGIPQLIMAGAAVDDVFVIVLFTSFTSLATGGNISLIKFTEIPISIFTGAFLGFFIGWILNLFFKTIHIRDSAKVIILLSISFLLVGLESQINNILPFSGLLSIMAIGMAILKFYPKLAPRLSNKFSKLWVAAEILLFVLVGATVNINYAINAGQKTMILLFVVLSFRLLGVFLSLIGTDLKPREKLFTMIAYTPKATVQAAIGGLPLAMGIPSGQLILTVAVLSILLTAPLGALGIDLLYVRCLEVD